MLVDVVVDVVVVIVVVEVELVSGLRGWRPASGVVGGRGGVIGEGDGCGAFCTC